MREIKFRAWYKKTSEMQEVKRIFFNEGTVTVGKGIDSRIWFIEDVVLMQFTGLKDVKGIDIYEGDIIKTTKDPFLYVKWDYDQWGLFDGICNEESIDTHFHEVIGNIYENKKFIMREIR